MKGVAVFCPSTEVGALGVGVGTLGAHFGLDGDVAFAVDLLEAGGEVGHVVELRLGRVVCHVEAVGGAVLAGVVPREQAYLLGSAAALVLGVGVAEDAAAALLGELLHRGPCELRAAVVVYAVGVARAECVERDTLDLVPVDLYAGR